MILRVFCLILALGTAAPAASAQTRDPEDHFFSLNTGDLKAEAADARAAGKKAILIMFEQDGCPGCTYMKEHVLNRVDVQNFYRQRFINFSLNIFGAVPVTDFAGGNHTEKSYAQAIGIKGTPTFLFYDLAGNEAVRIVGPVRTVEEFILLGEFVASGAYKSRKFADYRQEQQQKKKGS
jgi:thioredoxin-related protein